MKLAAQLLASVVMAANSVPINGRMPGWTVGVNTVDIEVEIFIDLLCEDSAHQNKILKQFLKTQWHGHSVSQQILFKIVISPLPYHNHSHSVA